MPLQMAREHEFATALNVRTQDKDRTGKIVDSVMKVHKQLGTDLHNPCFTRVLSAIRG